MTQIEFFGEKGRKHNICLPSEWDEMTASQVRFVFANYGRCLSGEISPVQLQILLLYHMLGLRRPSRKSARDEAVAANVMELCRHLDFIFIHGKNEGAVPQLSFCSVQNPLPTVRTKARVLTGPATLCQDLTFGEFRGAATALNTFFRTADMADLDECIAWLYRPRASVANKAGRKVKPVRPESFGGEVLAAGALKDWEKNLIMLWFSACINYLQTGTITLGGEDVDMSALFSDTTGSGPASTWNDLLVQIARENIVGPVDAVDETPLMVVILYLWSNYKEYKRHERTAKARKTRKA